VARALASRPHIIFADEPTGNLDSRTGAEILSFMRQAVREFGQTIVMVTHDPVAASYADRAVFLADGHIVDEVTDPTADSVLSHMRTLGPEHHVFTHHQQHPRKKVRFLLTGVAVILGVAFMAGTFVLTDTIKASYDAVASNVWPAGLDPARRPRVCVAEPAATVVALSGDYDFQFMIEELAVGAQFNLPYIHVLVNNAYLGLIRQAQRGLDMDFCVQLSFDNINAPELNGYGVDHVTSPRASGARRYGCSSRTTSCPRSSRPRS